MRDRPHILFCENEYEKIDLIRDWAYEKIVYAGDAETYSDENAELYVEKLVAGEFIDYGYFCGGAASVLCNIYSYLGYDTCSLDMAICDEAGNVCASHVVTLVYVDDKWIVEDVTFNITYVDEEGKNLDIFSIRESVENNESVSMRHGDTYWRKCIMSTEDYNLVYDHKEEYVVERGKYFFWMNTDINKYLDLVKNYFVNDGYNEESAAMYMYPYGIGIANHTREKKAFNQNLYDELKRGLGDHVLWY